MVGVDVLFVLASAAGDALGSPSISPGSSRMPAWHRTAITLVVPPRALRSRWPFRHAEWTALASDLASQRHELEANG